VRDADDALDVEDVAAGVGDGLAVEDLGVRPHRGAPRVEVVGVLDERRRDAELGQRVAEQVDRAAVEAGARDDVVARLGDVEDRQRLRRLPRRDEQRADAAVEVGDPLLDGVRRRVGDARVDVAQLGQREEVAACSVSRKAKDVVWWMGSAREPVLGSGAAPAWIWRVSNDQAAGASSATPWVTGSSSRPVDGVGWSAGGVVGTGVSSARGSCEPALAAPGRVAARSSPGAPRRRRRVAGQRAGACRWRS
jgi:hypothetical protein